MVQDNTGHAPVSAGHLFEVVLDRLREAGIEEAHQETRWLLEDILVVPYASIRSGSAPVPSHEQVNRVLELTDKRISGMPLAYVLGSITFHSHRFKLAPGLMVPRPETEILVEAALNVLNKHPWSHPCILDCYTGPGNVLLSIMATRRDVYGIGIDINPVAIECATVNSAALGCAGARYIEGDVATIIPELEQRFCLLTANPPYVAAGDIPTLQREITDHEDRITLDGGPDGLAQFKVLADLAPRVIISGGYLLTEFGADQKESVEKIFGGWTHLNFVADFNNLPRILVARP